MDLWPHQQRGLEEILDALGRDERRVLVTAPTGGGKTAMMSELIAHFASQGKKIALYTNRKLLIEQTSRVLATAGVAHGVRASGWQDERERLVQICSIQTEHTRGKRYKEQARLWQLHDADGVLVDEAHSQTGPTMQKILQTHSQAGAAIVGFTATPIGLEKLYDRLIVAGTPSELRACGALVPALHYGPDEPDLRKLKRWQAGEDLSENQQRQAMMRPGLWGRVWEWFGKLNPLHRPTLLFAPGVRESIWFAEQFSAAGVPAAHIDGQDVWVDGKLERSSRTLREEVLRATKSGDIRVLCNRFVLREGVDLPWLEHIILATVFGSLQSYLQAGGRVLRAYPGLERVCVQDHGSNWWRHGSLNADRDWSLDDTGTRIAALREERMRAKPEQEPTRCPQCGLILSVRVCPGCGYEVPAGKRSRPVVTAKGDLIDLEGSVYHRRQTFMLDRDQAASLWRRMLERSWVCKKPGTAAYQRTFRAAEALFAVENHWLWPPRDLPWMPLRPEDWVRRVRDVPRERLRQPS